MKKLLAIALAACFAPIALPQRSEAQAEAVAIPCLASGVCVIIGTVVIGGVAYYVLQNRQGNRWRVPTDDSRNYQPHPYPQPRPGPRPEMRTQYNEPGKIEVHAVTTADLCRRMEQRFLMQGRRLKLHRIRRTTNPGLRYDCEFIGEDAVEGWFHDRRGGR